jgi:hypothetical protein
VRVGEALAFEGSLSPRLAVRPSRLRAIERGHFDAVDMSLGTFCGYAAVKPMKNRANKICGDIGDIGAGDMNVPVISAPLTFVRTFESGS